MDALTETLYSTDSADSGSGLMKLVRLSLDFRKALITNAAANLSIVGYISLKNIKSRDDDDTNLNAMCDRMKAVRDRLKQLGVLESSMSGYLPLSGAPITQDIIVLTSRDNAKTSPFPGKPVPPGDDSIDPYADPTAQARIVVDPFAYQPNPSNMQVVVGYSLEPKIFQGVTGPIDPNNPLRTLHQFSVTITRAFHRKSANGFEFSPISTSVTIDSKGNVTSVQDGVQFALVASLLSGWIQVSGFVQAMVGVNWSRKATGQALVVGVAQGALGGQILVTPKFKGGGVLKFLRDHVQIGIQGMATGNLPGVGAATAGAQGAVIINIPFDL